MAGLPLALLAMHVPIAISCDRYAFPAYPFFLANLVVLPWMFAPQGLRATMQSDCPAGNHNHGSTHLNTGTTQRS